MLFCNDHLPKIPGHAPLTNWRPVELGMARIFETAIDFFTPSWWRATVLFGKLPTVEHSSFFFCSIDQFKEQCQYERVRHLSDERYGCATCNAMHGSKIKKYTVSRGFFSSLLSLARVEEGCSAMGSQWLLGSARVFLFPRPRISINHCCALFCSRPCTIEFGLEFPGGKKRGTTRGNETRSFLLHPSSLRIESCIDPCLPLSPPYTVIRNLRDTVGRISSIKACTFFSFPILIQKHPPHNQQNPNPTQPTQTKSNHAFHPRCLILCHRHDDDARIRRRSGRYPGR